MQEIQYIGELVWPSNVGHLLAITAFITAFSGAFAYFRSVNSTDYHWKRLGRAFFAIHGLSVLSIIGMILYLMITKRYEYAYVWEHVSDDLPMQYILSAFWEGQEGSFLLWMFWHVILGASIIALTRKWEDRVMWSFMAVEGFIASMLLGVYFTGSIKVGVDPFALLRSTMQAPIFSRPDYLDLIEGSGLNPLLQNYWMTIHPPTLFLGFASVTVPFAFAIGSLHSRDYRGWLKPVLPWALFSAGILGTGILMGGAWAYEALSFGGYWAWDPVENMSLVPWIILVAAIHGNLVSRATGHSLRATYGFYAFAFLLVLYSTFLTRSGILGDSSAHAFTQMGLEWQLVAFIAAFTGLTLYYLITQWNSIPQPEKEEKLVAREFWMFIGTLVLLFSAILISFTTSIPVYNKILDGVAWIAGTDFSNLHRSAPIDPEAHYNKFQLWIAVFISLLSSGAQYLRYREMNWSSYRKEFIKNMATAVLLAAALTVALTQWINIHAWQYWVLVATAAFAVIANLQYLIATLRTSPKMVGSSLAHLGFGVMIVGVLASGLNKSILSTNPFAQMGVLGGMDPERYVKLIKDRPMFMNGYWVEYERDTIIGNMRKFIISYKKINENADTVERFEVTPNVLFNNQLTKVEATNPSTKRYAHKDIFTYVAALPGEQMDIEEAKKINDTLNFVQYNLSVGDSIATQDYVLVLDTVSDRIASSDYRARAGDMPVAIDFRVTDLKSGESSAHNASVYVRDGLIYGFPAQINDLNMRVRLSDAAVSAFYTPEDILDFEMYALHTGETLELGDVTISLLAIDKNARHPEYRPEEGDIAVSAILGVRSGEEVYEMRPIYFIRGNRSLNIREFLPELGLHVRFEKIDPQSETFYFNIALDNKDRSVVPLEIALNVPRNDIIVIEAIVFPGINLFWLGASLMMIGLFIAMWVRRMKRAAA